ncbi:MAG: hydantoinase B/oxoprolinase family protein [Thermoleophilia bacterium]
MSLIEDELGQLPGPPTRPRVEVDPITLRVLGGAFQAIAKEMASVLFRMAYSSIIRESEDLGAGIFDAEGRELCESDSTPMHIGSLPWYIRGFLRRLRGEIRDGDVIVHNHPYLGASHTPDVGVATPLFWNGELLGFAAVTGHVLDVGGSFPGINPDSYDVYAEAKLYNGLRWYREGELNVEVDRMIFDNVRTETMNRGDLGAMLAAVTLGKQRFLKLVERYGPDLVMSSAYDWMDYSEKMLRAEIAKVPDGVYVAPTTWLDDDGVNRGKPLQVEVKVIVEGDEITIDTTGTTPEVPTGFNVPYEGSACVAAYYAIRTILLDEALTPERVPQNEGCFRPVKLVAPKGTLYNPRFPRACFSRFCQCNRLVDSTVLALTNALPKQTLAGSSAALTAAVYSGYVAERGEYWVHIEINEGSYGGRYGKDGMDAIDCHLANTRNNPIEECDMRFPLRCDQYELRPEPAAPGQWRGGVGMVRVNRFTEDGFMASEAAGHHMAPKAVFGGWDGLQGSMTKNAGLGDARDLYALFTDIQFRAGDYVEIKVPNSAGYGDPLDRDPAAVREDVLDDYTPLELARDAYGVVFRPGPDLEVDEEATAALRAELRARTDRVRGLEDYLAAKPVAPAPPAATTAGNRAFGLTG